MPRASSSPSLGRRPPRVTAGDEEAAVNLMTPRFLAGSLVVASVGWMLLALLWAPGRFIPSPQPVHLTHQLVALFTG
jgi:hypothetical protein